MIRAMGRLWDDDGQDVAEYAVLLAVIGCGKPAAPPPGAPEEAATPKVDIGRESSPTESVPAASDSPAGTSPQDQQGDQK